MGPHLSKVDDVLEPGLTLLSWTSINIDQFIESARGALGKILKTLTEIALYRKTSFLDEPLGAFKCQYEGTSGLGSGGAVVASALSKILVCLKFGQNLKKFEQRDFDIIWNINEIILVIECMNRNWLCCRKHIKYI